MPSLEYVTIPITSFPYSFTAPANGYVYFAFTMSAGTNYVYLNRETDNAEWSDCSILAGGFYRPKLVLKRGDSIGLYTDGTLITVHQARFYYTDGEA